MFDLDTTAVSKVLGLAVILAPAVLTAVMGVTSLLGRQLPERTTGRLCQAATAVGLVAAVGILALMLAGGLLHVTLELGEWVSFPGYHFHTKFVFDRLSVPFVILSFVLCGTIGAFAVR